MAKNYREELRTRVLNKLADGLVSSEMRSALAKVTAQPSASIRSEYQLQSMPYSELATPRDEHTAYDEVVFVTGRFRSGSTMLWNVFRHLGDFTSYYEPFNERRWFDSENRGDMVDSTHLGVAVYWHEYEGLSHLTQWFREDWIRYHLYMDAVHFDYPMKRYIKELIKAAEKRPVLQFNRIDFRLPWIRANFPGSKLIHIYRNPRDQWCSFLGSANMTCTDDVDQFIDRFYLHVWSQDLSSLFPFLCDNIARHPYQKFYFLWRLSYIFGVKHSDLSLSMEDLASNPVEHLRSLADVINYSGDIERAREVISEPVLNKWEAFATDSWFNEHETYCEEILADFLGLSN